MHLIAQIEAAATFGSAPLRPPVILPRKTRASAAELAGRAISILQKVWQYLRGAMIVYPTGTLNRIYVRPGQNPESDPAEWYEDEAKTKPIQFKIEFTAGRAEVPDTLGRWLCQNGYVKRSRLILPTTMLHHA